MPYAWTCCDSGSGANGNLKWYRPEVPIADRGYKGAIESAIGDVNGWRTRS